VATKEGVGLGGFVALLDPAARAALLGLGRVRRYRRGATVLLQGASGDTVCVVLEGRVKVTIDTPDGREVVLAVLGPGCLLGHFEAIEPELVGNSASNIALEPVECRVFAADDLRRFLVAHPAAALALLRVTVRALCAADQRRVDAAALDASHRLAHFLVERADAQHKPELDIALTQEELASLIAASRESVVRALTALRSRGLIETGRRQITIRDMEGLRAYAG
jgi:CRP/FNR family transcriptional regulator, cyclic AMP receptor protein